MLLGKGEAMKDVVLVAIGGALGALLRFGIGGWIQSNVLTFPVSTFLVNLVGSFLLGFVMYAAEFGGMVSREFRIFFTIGFLGSFTTFSSLEYESLRLLESGEVLFFLWNLVGNALLGLGAVFSGKILAVAFFWRP